MTKKNILLTIKKNQNTNYNINNLSKNYSNNNTYLKTPIKQNHYKTNIKQKHNTLTPKNTLQQHHITKLPPNKKYHLFISYSTKNITKINKIYKKLKNKFFFKYIQHNKNFIIKKPLNNNIQSKITKNIKILILINPTYITNH